MPRLLQASPVFPVEDVAATAGWYAETLGFDCHPFPAEEPFERASLRRDNVEIVLFHQPASPPAPRPPTEANARPDVVIRVADLREYFATVSRRSPQPPSPLTRRLDGELEFRLTDPNGFVLSFTEREAKPTPSTPTPAAAAETARPPEEVRRRSPGPDGFADVADVDSLAPGRCRTVEVRGRRYALCNVGGEFYAVDDACPHRAGPLGAGTLEGHEVYCPLHGWAFDVRTGHCGTNPSRPVRTYPVRVVGGRVWLQLPPA